MEIAGAEKDLVQIKTESRETKQKLLAEQEEIRLIKDCFEFIQYIDEIQPLFKLLIQHTDIL